MTSLFSPDQKLTNRIHAKKLTDISMDEWYNLNRIEVFAESDSLLAMTEIN